MLRQEFETIQSRWQELCRNGHLPTRADFPPESLTPWMGHIQIVERVSEGGQVRHRVRLAGTRIVYYEGRDNTGLFLDDVVPTDQREDILEPYRRCAETRAPVYSAFYSCSEAAISSQLERLILPLAADGKNVDQFLVAISRTNVGTRSNIALLYAPPPSWPDEEPAIQICFRATGPELDHRHERLGASAGAIVDHLSSC